MNKHYREYWKKLLETVAFSYGKVSLYELVQKEHKHFHPTGDPDPSQQDRHITTRLEKAGRILGIPLIDHIIIGEDDFYSFRGHGKIAMELPGNVA